MVLSIEQRATLFEAAEAEDLVAIESLLQQDAVRTQAQATELFIQRNPGSQDHIYPWYRMPPTQEYASYQYRTIFSFAVIAGRFELIQWFFSPARIAYLGATLAHVWHNTTQAAITTRQTEIVELLLNVSRALFPADQLQLKLNRLIDVSCFCEGDTAKLLLAHGLQIHAGDVLERCAEMGSEDLVDAFVADGAFVVGADVLSSCSRAGFVGVAQRLVRAGADCNSRSAVLGLAAEVVELELVDLYLSEGFADVDARDDDGQTALMLAVLSNSSVHSRSVDAVLKVVQVLLGAGADVGLRGFKNWTALHCAMRGEFDEVVEMLLRHGADPNDVVSDTEFIDDMVAFSEEEPSLWVRMELLLRYGGDPYTTSRHRVYERTDGLGVR